MKVVLIGDGPLARELAALAEGSGHEVAARVLGETDGAALAETIEPGVDLAVEAVVADATQKRNIVTELDRRLPPEVPILTAALNATATEVASWCHHPARVVGFAMLPPLGPVAEVVPALQSGDAARRAARDFWRSVGREPVEIADGVGGVLPRVVCTLVNEAAFALMEGVATPDDIDRAMQLGTNHPRGPLAWGDLIGLGQVVGILGALGDEYGPDAYRPAPLLRQYARAGRKFYPDHSTTRRS